MSPQPLEQRVERLERRMTTLEELPARVEALESQVVQLRKEMHDEFSALRGDVRAGDEELRAEIRTGDEETRREVRLQIKAMGDRLEAGIDDAKRLARVLHEEVIERISRIGEALGGPPAKKPADG